MKCESPPTERAILLSAEPLLHAETHTELSLIHANIHNIRLQTTVLEAEQNTQRRLLIQHSQRAEREDHRFSYFIFYILSAVQVLAPVMYLTAGVRKKSSCEHICTEDRPILYLN